MFFHVAGAKEVGRSILTIRNKRPTVGLSKKASDAGKLLKFRVSSFIYSMEE